MCVSEVKLISKIAKHQPSILIKNNLWESQLLFRLDIGVMALWNGISMFCLRLHINININMFLKKAKCKVQWYYERMILKTVKLKTITEK